MHSNATRVLVVGILGALALFGPLVNRSSAQQSCDEFDECTINATCQPDGTCQGTAQPNGTSCDDGNPCTNTDGCMAGHCQGLPNFGANGTSCASLFGGVFGSCLLSATCQFGACLPSFKTCPATDSNNCTFDICNPANGQCMVITNTCQDACLSAQCDPASGECINEQPINNGGACDDFNVCTANDRCNNGECGGAAGSPAPTSTRSPTPTLTLTTGAASATPTRTPTSGVASVTPTRTTTSGPRCEGDCGDCNGDGCISFDEIVRAVHGALEQENVDDCSLDLDENGAIDVDEIIAAINSMGRPCGVTPTPTTAAATPNTPAATAAPTTTFTSLPTTGSSPTPTTTGLPSVIATLSPTRTVSPTATTGGTAATTASRSAGTIQSATSVLLVIPQVLSAVLGHVTPSLGMRATIFTLPFTCPGGGGGTLACDQAINPGFPPTLGAPVYTVQLNTCKASASTGATLTFNGTLTYTGNEGDVCGSVPESGTLAIPALTIEEAGSAGTVTATFSSFSAGVTLAEPVDECHYNIVGLEVAGALAVTAKNPGGELISSTEAMFEPGTSLIITVQQYGSECVPEIYTMDVNGVVTFASGGSSFQGTFESFTMSNNTTSGSNHVGLDGLVTSECFGGGVSFLTRSDLIVDAGAACPRMGEESVYHGPDFSTGDLIRYTASGLELDYGDDDSVDATFNSCVDPRLFICPM